jgi:hypothetical protein
MARRHRPGLPIIFVTGFSRDGRARRPRDWAYNAETDRPWFIGRQCSRTAGGFARNCDLRSPAALDVHLPLCSKADFHIAPFRTIVLYPNLAGTLPDLVLPLQVLRRHFEFARQVRDCLYRGRIVDISRQPSITLGSLAKFACILHRTPRERNQTECRRLRFVFSP